MRKYAVIVAGGSGTRINSDIPKQFIVVHGKPVLYYTINTFLNAYDDMQVILVLPEEHLAKGQEIIDGFFDSSRIQLITGGRTRFHSVQQGLSLVDTAEESIIFVHDGVRCFITESLIHRCYDNALEKGTAIPVIRPKDSIRVLNEEDSEQLDRDFIRLVQTPQTFHSRILLPAYNIDYKDKFTDEASVVEAFGLKVSLVEGEDNNYKITTPVDLMIARTLLSE
jgi:2-C-methyl-D-erythritol 4-phosphate cytidylyltransferase